MTSDPLAGFADLHDWPGKRPPVNRSAPKIDPPEIDPWDAKPRLYKVNGVDTPFFDVADLGRAVNRSARTIRHWESKRIIPPATFRSPKPRKSALKTVGDRLYSHAQIEVVIEAAEAEGVLDGKPPSKAFTARIIRGWIALQKGTTDARQASDEEGTGTAG